MTTRTKEEQQLLDEKIARIQKKNEEILRRQREIEEDKRLAEQQNAVVKLRPSTANVSRERTPALKPSNRELKQDFPDDNPFQEPVIQRSTRGSFRGRGGDRFRSQGDWKATGGPPPDPKSFLYDDERDGPVRDRNVKDQRREMERGRRGDERDNRDSYHGGREFQRGKPRGGNEQRLDRGRRGGRGGGSKSEEDAWRAERMRIDEARIQRQKAADGKWRREWDNEKLSQESLDEPRYEMRRPNQGHQDQWRSPNQHQSQSHFHSEHTNHQPRGIPKGGRGRGRLDLTQLEIGLEKIQIEDLQKQTSPVVRSISRCTTSDIQRPPSDVDGMSTTPVHVDKLGSNPLRSVECVDNTVKISIPNLNTAHTTPKPQRQPNEPRSRFRSRTSCSSQSEDESPKEKSHRSGGRRQRNQKFQKHQLKTGPTTSFTSTSDFVTEEKVENLPAQNKPPLPPFRSELKPPTRSEMKDGDDSWEDATTSGTESMGEELSSVGSSPAKKHPLNELVANSEMQGVSVIEEYIVSGMTPQQFLQFESSNCTSDKFGNQMSDVAQQELTLEENNLHMHVIVDDQFKNDGFLQTSGSDDVLAKNMSHDVSNKVSSKVTETSENQIPQETFKTLCMGSQENYSTQENLINFIGTQQSLIKEESSILPDIQTEETGKNSNPLDNQNEIFNKDLEVEGISGLAENVAGGEHSKEVRENTVSLLIEKTDTSLPDENELLVAKLPQEPDKKNIEQENEEIKNESNSVAIESEK